MQHLSITFPESLRIALDREARVEHTKRSTLIQKAVKIYLDLKHRRKTRQLLMEGYQEMALESKELDCAFRHADAESLKYVD